MASLASRSERPFVMEVTIPTHLSNRCKRLIRRITTRPVMAAIAHNVNVSIHGQEFSLMPVLWRVLAAGAQGHASRMCGMLSAHDRQDNPTPTG